MSIRTHRSWTALVPQTRRAPHVWSGASATYGPCGLSWGRRRSTRSCACSPASATRRASCSAPPVVPASYSSAAAAAERRYLGSPAQTREARAPVEGPNATRGRSSCGLVLFLRWRPGPCFAVNKIRLDGYCAAWKATSIPTSLPAGLRGLPVRGNDRCDGPNRRGHRRALRLRCVPPFPSTNLLPRPVR